MKIEPEVWKAACDAAAEVCRAYGRAELKNRIIEKEELDKYYDPNCYGAGFSAGLVRAAIQLAEDIRALPCPTE